jgi:uncharacterized protein
VQYLPIELVVVQATGFCNLNCTYCYLSEGTRKAKDRIPLSSLSKYFSKILSSRLLGDRLIVSWHSGEPLVLGPRYYEAAVDAITRLKEEFCPPGFKIFHDIQTNGTLLDEDWCDFFRKYQDVFTVGISCDGPAHMHDAYRTDWRNAGTFERTRKGMELLIKHEIKFSLIAVVSPRTLDHPDEFFDFFYSYRSHISEIRFNLLDQFLDSGELSYSDSSPKYYSFLKRLLDRIESCESKEEILNIKNFSYFYNRLFTSSEERKKKTASYMSLPFRAFNIAANGDVSTFYAGVTVDECEDIYGDNRGLVIGNIDIQSIDEIMQSAKLAQIASDFKRSHSSCESECPYFDLCPGGYNLVKFKRYGTFDVAETPECKIQVKVFTDALMDHMNDNLEAAAGNQ